MKVLALTALAIVGAHADCSSYCTDMAAKCTNEKFPVSCADRCALFPAGAASDTAGNTLGCREYHESVADVATSPHCSHAGVGGTDSTGTAPCSNACAAYCAAYMSTCASEPGAYSSQADCEAQCAAFPSDGGLYGAEGNFVECRDYHVTVASTADKALHCTHGSADGAGVCGDKCDVYCTSIMARCTGDNAPFTDKAACTAACALFPDGTRGATDGNSLACRNYHSGVAATSGNADAHCPHAASIGAGVCGDQCAAYCAQIQSTCTGANAQYADEAACLATCKIMPLGVLKDKAGNSLGCREYHRQVASASSDNAAVHCPHAGPFGEAPATADAAASAVCGDRCDLYCNGMDTVCSGKYASVMACKTACANFAVGEASDISGDTLACRTYHLQVAASSTGTDVALHCGHAQETPTEACVAFSGAAQAAPASVFALLSILAATMFM